MSVSFSSFRRLRESRSRVHSADRRFHHRWTVISIAASPHVLTSNLKTVYSIVVTSVRSSRRAFKRLSKKLNLRFERGKCR